jgi:hypothetical protein
MWNQKENEGDSIEGRRWWGMCGMGQDSLKEMFQN